MCRKILPLSIINFINYFRTRINILIFRIRKNGYVSTCKELFPLYLYHSCAFFFSLPASLIIYIVSPVIKIRFVRLLSERLGHFCLNTEIMLCAFDAGRLDKKCCPARRYYFYTHRVVANTQVHKMWKRILPILSFPIVCLQIDKFLSLYSAEYKNYIIKKTVEDGNFAKDKWGLLEQFQPHVFFTQEEEMLGKILLKQLGLQANSPHICLAVRDSLYLERLFPEDNWRYHDHRNADVMTYKKVALFLAEKGYYVIRMGKWVADHFDVNHPLIIDYANHALRSDFLDVYLSSKCQFFMSTSTGVDALSQLFRRPLLFTNVSIPNELQTHAAHSLFIHKKIKNKLTGKLLTYAEIHKIFLLGERVMPDFFVKNNLELIDNTEDEIVEVVCEMIKNLSNVHTESIADHERKKQILKEYCYHIVENPSDVKVKVGNDFSIQYGFLSGVHRTGVGNVK